MAERGHGGTKRAILEVEAYCIKGICDVFELKIGGSDDDGDYVEAYLFFALMLDDVGVSKADVSALFVAGDELFGFAAFGVGARFHLHKDQRALIVGDEVGLVAAVAPVGGDDGVAFFLKVFACKFLTDAAYAFYVCHALVLKGRYRLRSTMSR